MRKLYTIARVTMATVVGTFIGVLLGAGFTFFINKLSSLLELSFLTLFCIITGVGVAAFGWYVANKIDYD